MEKPNEDIDMEKEDDSDNEMDDESLSDPSDTDVEADNALNEVHLKELKKQVTLKLWRLSVSVFVSVI